MRVLGQRDRDRNGSGRVPRVVLRTLPCPAAWIGVLLLASCPAVVFHATTPQPHALAFALAALATRAAISTRTMGAAAAGALVGPAYLLDPTAPLLLLWLVPLRGGDRAARSTAALLASALLTTGLLHVATFGGAPAAWPAPARPAAALGDAWSLGPLLQVFAKEGLRAFLPLSLLVAAAALRPRWARWAWPVAAAAGAGTLAHAYLAPWNGTEGGHLLPLAIPATLVAARMLRPRGQLAAVAIGLVLAAAKLAVHHDAGARAFARAARELGDDASATWLVSVDGPDRAACAVWLPRSQHIRIADVYVRSDPTTVAAIVRAHVARLHQEGRRVYLTWEAERELRRPHVRARFPAAAAVLTHLQREFTLAQVERGGLRAKEVRPRSGR